MSIHYVFRKESGSSDFEIDKIKTEEELYFSVFGKTSEIFFNNEYSSLKERFIEIFDTLEKREKEIIFLLYGFKNEKLSVKEIAERFGVSESSIVNTKEKILRSLRSRMKAWNIKSQWESWFSLYDRKDFSIDWNSILINEIKVHIFNQEGKISFLEGIFERYGINIKLGAFREHENDLKELGLSERCYNSLKTAGIETVSELYDKYESLDILKKLSNILQNEALTKLIEYSFGRNIDCYLTIRNIENHIYLKEDSIDCMAEQLFICLKESEKTKILTEYDLSVGLTSFLLLKGYFYLSDLLRDKACILKELESDHLISLKYEFTDFVEYISSNVENYKECVCVNAVNGRLVEYLLNHKPENTNCICDYFDYMEYKHLSDSDRRFFDQCKESDIKIIISEME